MGDVNKFEVSGTITAIRQGVNAKGSGWMSFLFVCTREADDGAVYIDKLDMFCMGKTIKEIADLGEGGKCTIRGRVGSREYVDKNGIPRLGLQLTIRAVADGVIGPRGGMQTASGPGTSTQAASGGPGGASVASRRSHTFPWSGFITSGEKGKEKFIRVTLLAPNDQGFSFPVNDARVEGRLCAVKWTDPGHSDSGTWLWWADEKDQWKDGDPGLKDAVTDIAF